MRILAEQTSESSHEIISQAVSSISEDAMANAMAKLPSAHHQRHNIKRYRLCLFYTVETIFLIDLYHFYIYRMRLFFIFGKEFISIF
jgi:hypothetical protein